MTSIDLWNEGKRLHNERKFIEAGQCYADAILQPDCAPEVKANCLNNEGIILQAYGHLDKAAQCFAYAMALNPKLAAARSNFGNVKYCLGDYIGANADFVKAIALDPNCVDARMNSATLSLLTGDLLRGFREYEWRWKVPTFTAKPFETSKPRWKGQDLTGKTILLTHEQGFGDSIMFIRYARMVKEKYNINLPIIKFLGPPQLSALLSQVYGVDEYLIASTDEAFDYHCPLLSLPMIFKTRLSAVSHMFPTISVPNFVPYIHAHSSGFPCYGNGVFKIGICWAGRAEHGRDRWRSVTAKHFEPLMDIEGTEWFSLQTGPKSDEFVEIKKLHPSPVPLIDFTDTASVIAGLDLVITVDTAVAHLAGAMGKPVWVLLAHNPDWRWMLERTDSPWYPTMKLFRQPKMDDWRSVFGMVELKLGAITGMTMI